MAKEKISRGSALLEKEIINLFLFWLIKSLG